MNRRSFLAAAGAAGVAPVGTLASSSGRSQAEDRQLYELREYTYLPGSGGSRLHEHLENVLVPAYNEIGVNPVGVFTVTHGRNDPTVYVFLPFDSAEQFITHRGRLREMDQYAEAIDPPIDEPNFTRYDSQLMRAFAGSPQASVPEGYGPGDTRIHEMRTYESQNEERAHRKVEMFNQGERAIFEKLGHPPVWLGDAIVGDQLPQMTYMLAFEDMTERDEFWATFLEDPDWAEMSENSYYADTVSTITSTVLSPTDYSQV